MLLKLGQQGCCTLQNIPDGSHFDIAMAACLVPVPFSSKSNITICNRTGHNIQLKMLKKLPNEGGTGICLRKDQVFCLVEQNNDDV